ncbi:MAG: metallophosphoesterase family protein [Candidatus Hydrogenedentes bacterium]|nr:metallophosphoesterase family protein [Candidatus Hydrogenedentota bacterium]
MHKLVENHLGMRLWVLALVLILMAASAVWAAPPAMPEHVPQRVLLGITSDPAHSQTVTWRTDVSVESPQAQIAPWTASPKFGDDAKTVSAIPAEFTTGSGVSVVHYEATFTGLEADKCYGYRVGDGTVWSEWFLIRTASEKAAPFTFIYLGDAQADVKSLWSRAAREAFKSAPDASLILHAGDLVNEGYDDHLWEEWCEGLGFIGAMVPNLPAVGNHDMNLPDGAPGLPVAAHPLWRAHFALPQNGPAGAPMLVDEAYWVDYQGVRFICLEGNAYSPEDYDPEARDIVQRKQVEWVEPLLAHNPNRWTVMLHHEPMYRTGRNADNPELREAFLALYDKYHVDLVLQGHDHVYARSYKLTDGRVVDNSAPGTVYVVSVSGPKMYSFDLTYRDLMKKVQENTQLFQIVDVSADRLRVEAWSVDGTWVDGFELHKDEAGISTLVEISGLDAGRREVQTHQRD